MGSLDFKNNKEFIVPHHINSWVVDANLLKPNSFSVQILKKSYFYFLKNIYLLRS